MHAIAQVLTSACATTLMRVKNSTYQFCLWNILSGKFLFSFRSLEEETLCLRKNLLSVNSVGWNIDATFCNVISDFYRENTEYYRVYGPNWKILIHRIENQTFLLLEIYHDLVFIMDEILQVKKSFFPIYQVFANMAA